MRFAMYDLRLPIGDWWPTFQSQIADCQSSIADRSRIPEVA